ncbi:MAG: hypothetical protein QGG17_07560 [Rhodospirillales bacterium]|jgi:hypothetical protein|nr:hypothetical protein [Rhodospirillales bacterium]MDP6804200.1 hypothetical protein [Rhodospirillales bacterium]
MRLRSAFAALVFVVAAPTLAGCELPPYVHQAGEFDRSSPMFKKEPADRETVSICYSRRHTASETLLRMAQAECGKYGKVARYTESEYLRCPVLTPAIAHFTCAAR